jgi:hypothetical protein
MVTYELSVSAAVSFLHDLQAVTHMLRSLDALSSISDEANSPPSADEHLLRGPYAESGEQTAPLLKTSKHYLATRLPLIFDSATC